MITRCMIDQLRKIVLQETKWGKHYIGKVLNAQDSTNNGRVCVAIYDLGCNDEGTGFWAYPRDKNSLTLPKQGDWVEIYFINWDKNRPVYMGIANEIQNMLPDNFDGTKQIIYESPQDLTHISFDESANSLEIGNSNMQPAARKNDTVKVTLPAGTYPTITAGITPIVVSAPLDLTGIITSGSNQVNIGDK
jgi:hypothetical protein